MTPAYTGKNRRKSKRVTLNVKVDYILRDGSKEGIIEATSMNISLNGMCIETEAPFPVGTEVILSFLLPDETKHTWIIGKVRWSMHSEDNRYLAGVLFKDMDAESRDMINRLIAKIDTTYPC